MIASNFLCAELTAEVAEGAEKKPRMNTKEHELFNRRVRREILTKIGKRGGVEKVPHIR